MLLIQQNCFKVKSSLLNNELCKILYKPCKCKKFTSALYKTVNSTLAHIIKMKARLLSCVFSSLTGGSQDESFICFLIVFQWTELSRWKGKQRCELRLHLSCWQHLWCNHKSSDIQWFSQSLRSWSQVLMSETHFFLTLKANSQPLWVSWKIWQCNC